MSAIKARITKLEQSAEVSNPRVSLVFCDCPDGAALPLFNSGGAELPADTEWKGQKPAAKVFTGINFDDV